MKKVKLIHYTSVQSKDSAVASEELSVHSEPEIDFVETSYYLFGFILIYRGIDDYFCD